MLVNSLFHVKAYCLLRKWSLLYVGRISCECHFFVDGFFSEHSVFFADSLCLVDGLFIADGLFFMRDIIVNGLFFEIVSAPWLASLFFAEQLGDYEIHTAAPFRSVDFIAVCIMSTTAKAQ